MTWLAEWVTVSTQARLYDVAPQCTGAFTLRGARTDKKPDSCLQAAAALLLAAALAGARLIPASRSQHLRITAALRRTFHRIVYRL